MLSVLAVKATSVRPLVMIPSMLGSVLKANLKKVKTHWYCPSNSKDKWIWVNDEFVIDPMYKCMLTYMTMSWDKGKQKAVDYDGVSMYVPDFGGIGAIKFLDHGIFGKHFIPVLDKFVDYFTDHDYIVRDNLWAAPYDWRINPIGQDDLYANIKALIEEAFNKHNQKVALFTYSAGSVVTNEFLTSFVDDEWRQKHIDRIIHLVPSLGGSIQSLSTVLTGQLPVEKIKPCQEGTNMVHTLPTLHAHYPHYAEFGDTVIINSTEGKVYAKDVIGYIKSHNVINESFYDLLDGPVSQYLSKEHKFTNISTYIIYNSKVKTPKTINFDGAFGSSISYTNGKGDGVITADSIHHLCGSWKGKTVICHDVEQPGSGYTHTSISRQDDVVQLVFNLVNNDEWLVGGNHNIEGHLHDPLAELVKQS